MINSFEDDTTKFKNFSQSFEIGFEIARKIKKLYAKN